MSVIAPTATRVTGRKLSALEATGTIVYRNLLVYRRSWLVFVSGFLEPVLYLFSIGIGVGKLIPGFEVDGHLIRYAAFVAPGMLAASAMNGALFDATFNVFFRLRYAKLYDQILATPRTPSDIARGEISWALLRGGIYSAAFLLVMAAMGLIDSWLAILALPAALLIGFAFAAIAMGLTTWMRSWQDFEYITLATLPMFLFSATFFPLSAFPAWLQWIVQCTPLYRGVVLCRELTTGHVTWASAVSVVYLIALGLLGTAIVRRRLAALLLT
ncbi:lipooligosaccharide transport system permease protein [Branchiibius hedensis]|uniref:Transport permease protein n=1 Tax=Branchiibius hedensis TaxID=672460 RepID=A0A2Y8ZQM3_9MICO|nr:ABC transporter permease [Branchiibius hedensis]PWJ24791.1 lipooligosaccharide transport system permease protein [Branchiibius hedensis]SSA33608.1 lipooligosaccharide transport system permease protein [Branchiibius hedensis]